MSSQTSGEINMHSDGKDANVISVTVVKHIPSGAICRFDQHGPMVRIRKAEIDWDPEKQNQETIPVGTSFDARLLDFDDERQIQYVSRKAVDDAPFYDFVQTYSSGGIVEATAVSRGQSGWVVRLPGGVEGTVRLEEFPQLPEQVNQDYVSAPELKPGDFIFLKVTDIVTAEHRIYLSLKSAVRHIAENEWQPLIEQGTKSYAVQKVSGATHSTLLPSQHETSSSSLRILVVDDNEELVDALAALLRDRSHRVYTAANLFQANSEMGKAQSLDAAVVDLQLALRSDTDLLPTLRKKFPGIRLILFTADLQRAAEYVKQHPDVSVLPKPSSPNEAFAVIEGRRPAPHLNADLERTIDQLARPDKEIATAPDDSAVRRLIDDHLSAIGDAVPGAGLIILRLHMSSNRVDILRTAGFERREIFPHLEELRFSFVGDVLAGGAYGQFLLDRAPNEDSLTRMMKDLRVDRVIGASVESHTIADPIAVFALYRKRSLPVNAGVTREYSQQTRALGLAIDRIVLDAGIARHQRAMTSGSLLLGMTHEFRNSVSTMRMLCGQSSLLLRNSSSVERDKQLSECHQRLEQQVENLHTVFESLLGMTRAASGKMRPALELVLDVVRQCHPTAMQDSVLLWLDEQPSKELSKVEVPAILAQVIMNLVLNAVQQTRAFRVDGGFVRVSVDHKSEAAGETLELRVQDNACGVDRVDEYKIFKIFESNRVGGSGLGLYVSRMIVSGLGGQISVETTHKFTGTTFLVRIPV